jgi:hypothetical protein
MKILMGCSWIWNLANLAGRWKKTWAYRRKDSRRLGKGFKGSYCMIKIWVNLIRTAILWKIKQ